MFFSAFRIQLLTAFTLSIGSLKQALSPHHKISIANQFMCMENGIEISDDVLVNSVANATNKNTLYLFNKEDVIPNQRVQQQHIPVTCMYYYYLHCNTLDFVTIII